MSKTSGLHNAGRAAQWSVIIGMSTTWTGCGNRTLGKSSSSSTTCTCNHFSNAFHDYYISLKTELFIHNRAAELRNIEKVHSLTSRTRASRSKRSVRCQSRTINNASLHSWRAVKLPKNHAPNLHLHKKIPDGQTWFIFYELLKYCCQRFCSVKCIYYILYKSVA